MEAKLPRARHWMSLFKQSVMVTGSLTAGWIVMAAFDVYFYEPPVWMLWIVLAIASYSFWRTSRPHFPFDAYVALTCFGLVMGGFVAGYLLSVLAGETGDQILITLMLLGIFAATLLCSVYLTLRKRLLEQA